MNHQVPSIAFLIVSFDAQRFLNFGDGLLLYFYCLRFKNLSPNTRSWSFTHFLPTAFFSQSGITTQDQA
jgi:hypothetical protein